MPVSLAADGRWRLGRALPTAAAVLREALGTHGLGLTVLRHMELLIAVRLLGGPGDAASPAATEEFVAGPPRSL